MVELTRSKFEIEGANAGVFLEVPGFLSRCFEFSGKNGVLT
jgi:hypothetical protein